MPSQEVFFEQESEGRRIEVLKSYDQNYAREAFKNMDEEAQQDLWNSMKPEELYDPAGIQIAAKGVCPERGKSIGDRSWRGM